VRIRYVSPRHLEKKRKKKFKKFFKKNLDTETQKHRRNIANMENVTENQKQQLHQLFPPRSPSHAAPRDSHYPNLMASRTAPLISPPSERI